MTSSKQALLTEANKIYTSSKPSKPQVNEIDYSSPNLTLSKHQ